MATFHEPMRPLEFLLSEASGMRSRENITLSAGLTLSAGAVLGRLDTGEYTQLNPTASNGSETAAGVLGYSVDGETAALGFVRDCEVGADLLVWPDEISAAEKTSALAALAALGIIAR